MKKFSVILTLLFLVSMMSATSAAPNTNCVLDDANPRFICLTISDEIPGYINLGDGVELGDNDLIYLGAVGIQPFGLGPIPAIGVGASDPCDMYVNMNCVSGDKTPVKEVSVAETEFCLDRSDIKFRVTADDSWNTIGFILTPGTNCGN